MSQTTARVAETAETEGSQTAIDKPLAESLQTGIMNYAYRGIPMLKCPFDLAIYMQVIWDLKPRTILEFGSRTGGSALWLADMLTTFGMSDRIVHSYDIHPVTAFTDSRIRFLKIDVAEPENYITGEMLRALPSPRLIIDDASHQYAHVLGLLQFLHPHLQKGDYLIVEDGIVNRLGMADQLSGGPLRAIREFLAAHPEYEIDRARCDTFGKNVTWNVDGYIKRL